MGATEGAIRVSFLILKLPTSIYRATGQWNRVGSGWGAYHEKVAVRVNSHAVGIVEHGGRGRAAIAAESLEPVPGDCERRTIYRRLAMRDRLVVYVV